MDRVSKIMMDRFICRYWFATGEALRETKRTLSVFPPIRDPLALLTVVKSPDVLAFTELSLVG